VAVGGGGSVAVGGGGSVAVGGGGSVAVGVGVSVGVGVLVDVGGTVGTGVCVGSGSPALVQAPSKSAAAATNAQCFNLIFFSPCNGWVQHNGEIVTQLQAKCNALEGMVVLWCMWGCGESCLGETFVPA
jgi:hypothetical protein